jgi:hypothetical protein
VLDGWRRFHPPDGHDRFGIQEVGPSAPTDKYVQVGDVSLNLTQRSTPGRVLSMSLSSELVMEYNLRYSLRDCLYLEGFFVI